MRSGPEPTVRKCLTVFYVLQASPLHRSNSCGPGPAHGRAGQRTQFSLLAVPGGCRRAQGPMAIAALTGCPKPPGPPSAPEGHPRAGSAPGTSCCAGEDPTHLCLPSNPPEGQTLRVGYGGHHSPGTSRTRWVPLPCPRGVSTSPSSLTPPPWLFSFATYFMIIFNVRCLSVLAMWTEPPRHLLRRKQPLVVILEFTPGLMWAASRGGTRQWHPSDPSPCAPWEPAAHRCPQGWCVAGAGVHRCQKQTRLR